MTLLLCPICAAEYGPGQDSCPNCGCRLLEVEAEAPQFVELCRPRSHHEAMLIKQLLEQNGIAVIIQGGHSLSLMPHLAFSGELRLKVAAGQADLARQLYRAYFEGDRGSELTWP